jgi:hypothetical protein
VPFTVFARNPQHEQCLIECNTVFNNLSPNVINVDHAYMWKQWIGLYGPRAATRLFAADGVHLSRDFKLRKSTTAAFVPQLVRL